MPLDHDNATANLTIDGLAICCFNPNERRWEVGFMRHEEHEFLLTLDNLPNPIAVPADARFVWIETVQGKTPDYDKEFRQGFFDHGPIDNRQRGVETFTKLERENFRWAMNLDEGADVPHGTITLKRPKYPVTMVYISDAVFYTNNITAKNLFLVPLSADPKTMAERALNKHLYGKTADEIGADINCAEGGSIRITIDGKEVSSLEQRPGEPRTISLMNMRKDQNHKGEGHGNPHMAAMGGMTGMAATAVTAVTAESDLEQGDFQIYYDSLDVTGDKYSLWGRRPPTAPTSGRTDCNTPWVAGDNLNGMIG